MAGCGGGRAYGEEREVARLALAKQGGLPFLGVAGPSHVDGDVVRNDVCVCQDVALLDVDDEGAAHRRALHLCLPWLRVVGVGPLDEDCTWLW